MSSLQKWIRLDSCWALDNPWCRVRQDTVQLPNGRVVDDYFVHVRPDIALVLPITADERVIFVRQYRHGIAEILLELPAGTFDAGQENSEAAARRELAEETGYQGNRFFKIAELFDNPVKNTNRIHLFRAEPVSLNGNQQLDPTEDIDVVPVSLAEIPAKIAAGEIAVAGTLAALYVGLGERLKSS
ncbi:MAG: NUDIX hydrolase [Cyanobacteria bacterium P01_H01_bin.15]